MWSKRALKPLLVQLWKHSLGSCTINQCPHQTASLSSRYIISLCDTSCWQMTVVLLSYLGSVHHTTNVMSLHLTSSQLTWVHLNRVCCVWWRLYFSLWQVLLEYSHLYSAVWWQTGSFHSTWPVQCGCEQLQHTQFIWSEIRWDDGCNVNNPDSTSRSIYMWMWRCRRCGLIMTTWLTIDWPRTDHGLITDWPQPHDWRWTDHGLTTTTWLTTWLTMDWPRAPVAPITTHLIASLTNNDSCVLAVLQ